MGEPATAAGARRSVGAQTLTEAFRLTIEENPDRVAVRTKEDEVRLTWAELGARADAMAGGLARLGVARGDTVALMLSNRPEFSVADLAVMTLGATPFSIYQQFTPDQIAYIVGDAGAKVAIVEAAFLETFGGGARAAPGARDGHRRRGRRVGPTRRTGATSRAPIPASTPSRTGRRSSPTISSPSSTPRARPGRRRASRSRTATSWRAPGRRTGSSTSPTTRA